MSGLSDDRRAGEPRVAEPSSSRDSDAPWEQLVAVLQGRWLGHPLHPALTDLPIGAWTASLGLDAIGGIARDSESWRLAADATLAGSIAAGAPTLLTGMAELMTRTRGRSRTLACIHGCFQCMALAAGGASVIARAMGFRPVGLGLSLAGYGLLITGAWLGGELVYREGAGTEAR